MLALAVFFRINEHKTVLPVEVDSRTICVDNHKPAADVWGDMALHHGKGIIDQIPAKTTSLEVEFDGEPGYFYRRIAETVFGEFRNDRVGIVNLADDNRDIPQHLPGRWGIFVYINVCLCKVLVVKMLTLPLKESSQSAVL